ncbi:MAG: 5'-methylthioadenosine/adenosylhomocysteine nucleosidase [Brevibacillus sp.]|nr:5'-methylthioadenosine/adenosylhomocysteine nucleosidase [Brevibacillus sp.]
MRIGIIGAMDEEIALYQAAMKKTTSSVRAGITYWEGILAGQNVVLCKSGVGKVNASVCTQILIDQYQVDRVIFTGVAGAVHPELEIGDIVVSTDCLQHDMDVTALGFQPGQIPYQEKWVWEADAELVRLAVRAGETIGGESRVIEGRILSGDQFLADREKVKRLYEQFSAHCTEMEGAAVAQVCAMNEIPFVIVRSMSDKADGSAHVNFVEFTKLAAERSFAIVSGMLQNMTPQSAQVIVYSTKGCIDCDLVKQYLKQRGIDHEVRDVMERQEYRDEVERFGFLGVPVTVVGDKAVKGYNPAELDQLLQKG